MNKKSKAIFGLKKGISIIPFQSVTKSFRKCFPLGVRKGISGEPEEHGQPLRWMRELGYNDELRTRRTTFYQNGWKGIDIGIEEIYY